MIYPNIDLKIWAKRYGVKPKSKTCLCCKQEFKTTIPVAIKGYRGLQTPVHKCGERYINSIFVPIEKSEIEFWLNFKYGT